MWCNSQIQNRHLRLRMALSALILDFGFVFSFWSGYTVAAGMWAPKCVVLLDWLENLICVLLETQHKIKKKERKLIILLDFVSPISIFSLCFIFPPLSKRLSLSFFDSSLIEPEVFCGNPGVLSLCHRMDAIMQTNVSAELRGSIYPLSNYINRSWIVTNGSWRRRREGRRSGGGTHDEELERPGMHDCIFPSYFTLSLVPVPRSLPVLRLEIPPNNPKLIHTHTHSHTDPLSLFPAWKTSV